MIMDISNTKIPYIVTPKLRKNRRIENRWGLQYEISVQYAAFGRQCLPYMPTESPVPLSEEIVESEPLYVCEQCKDCFRFQSSLEDHSKRRSWIFGIWCHSCFRTVCSHIPEIGSVCSICMGKDSEKRLYLRSRGFDFQRVRKWGAAKVFYNQCQLFEHMKLHGLCSIDVSDVMLMPLPAGLSYSDWTPELEIACEALMEYTFLSRIHIMDWLRLNKIENNWWKLIDNNINDDNMISKIVRGYKGRQLFKTFEKSEEDQNSNSDLSNMNSLHMGFIDASFKNKNKNNHSANAILDKNVSENEDNPCMTTDIAFVDCGPISRCFEPEPPVSYVSGKQMSVLKKSRQDISNLNSTARTNCKRKKTVFHDLCFIETDMSYKNTTMAKVGEKTANKSTMNKQSLKDSSKQLKAKQSFVKKTVGNSISKPVIETDVTKTLDNSIKIDVPFSAKKIKLHKANSDNSEHNPQTLIEICDPKMLTVQSSKKADATLIISDQLITNNKKAFEQKCITFHDKDVITIEKRPKKLILPNSSTTIKTLPQKKQVAGKYLIKDGKRYLIKESIKKNAGNSSNLLVTDNVSKGTKCLISKSNISISTSTNSGEVENIGMEQVTSPHNDISFLTPSPSPSELSSGSSCELHIKQTLKAKLRKEPPQLILLNDISHEIISFVKEEHGEDLYMNVKIIDHIPKDSSLDMSKEVPKYRQKMIEEFYHMSKSDLMERINHLQDLSEEMKKSMNFLSNNLISEKLKSIKTLLLILEDCINIHDKIAQDKQNDDVILNEWKKTDLHQKCPLCHKPMKPKSYVVGFSKFTRDDDLYCYCYKYLCHVCLSYQGTSSRFIAHQNLHMKMEPYICPDCRYNFIDATFLEIHMWTACFHTLKRRVFACKICEIDGFRDIESITRHFVMMHCVTKIACEICHLIFSTYGDYIKHYTRIHTNMPEPKPIRLVMCKLGNEIIRYENFISYLYKCPAIQEITWYKCPFCSLVTLENEHVTMILFDHLRDLHMKRLFEVMSKKTFTIIMKKRFEKNSIPQGILHTFVNAPSEDGTVIPKIINTQTISSEIFERGSHGTWPTNSNESTSIIMPDTGSQKTQKVDSLPKILNVRSMADLKATTSQSAAESEVIKTIYEKGDLSSGDTEKIIIDDIKSDISEKAKKLEPGKCNDESIASYADETRKSLQKDDICINLFTETSKEISHSELVSKTSTTGRIKVIDIRKICKPNIEPFIEELYDKQPENENAVDVIPKPPPLARIPQHILNYRETEKACKSRNVARSTSLSRRVAKKRRRIAICESTDTQEEYIEFLCHICNERINTSWPVVRTHYTENHSREYQLAALTLRLKRLPVDYRRYYKRLLSNKKRKSDVSLPTAKRKRRLPKKHTETKDTSTPEVGLCVKEETAEDGEGNFKCKKCDQRCTDMSDLREHIAANHRLKGLYLICLECGENFVVAPSLQMHLKAFHGIEDPISYMNQNSSYAPDAYNDLMVEGKTTVANQCYVCMAVFEDKAAVDKHLRVHGMAFLNRKRIEARNALRSPEKKSNTEENKESCVPKCPKVTIKRDKPVEAILEKLNAAI
ncbi:uncharacterized protein LOC116841773 isoform X2 [Odontomachus brunneus]|uniref:uncharacterized protein LOC116841773 isoform X2 n=1 Tax=Odontomachus brunneus TaxID=486640 RepID=UPI0013F27F9B|nr:uncharacterized protein LOC116841773 isoform X2 [Odontomachus brunneus]XP_032666010.1 uncharacterized protein LOC116841773 isoform X2 [Odontomachus brunneus]